MMLKNAISCIFGTNNNVEDIFLRKHHTLMRANSAAKQHTYIHTVKQCSLHISVTSSTLFQTSMFTGS